jgi:DNA-binding sugar fermentation-stimulating protein
MKQILKLDVIEGEILKRPSAYIKTPYVGDVELKNDNVFSSLEKESYLLHTPALGCCGLSDKGSIILMTELEKSKTRKCKYRADLAVLKEDENTTIVGINPALAEKIIDKCLELDIIDILKGNQKYYSQAKIMNSRFDFAGVDCNGKQFFLEVKNVPLADYVDCSKSDRKKINIQSLNKKHNEKISYFPDGYRKKAKDVVSPRALKHIQELEEIVKTHSNIRCILCFVVQRDDSCVFQTSVLDPIYKTAVKKAYESGVEIICLQTSWNIKGECYYNKMLPLNL